jgi:hypothetical protein
MLLSRLWNRLCGQFDKQPLGIAGGPVLGRRTAWRQVALWLRLRVDRVLSLGCQF